MPFLIPKFGAYALLECQNFGFDGESTTDEQAPLPLFISRPGTREPFRLNPGPFKFLRVQGTLGS